MRSGLFLLALLLEAAASFHVAPRAPSPICMAGGGKGFGAASPPPPPSASSKKKGKKMKKAAAPGPVLATAAATATASKAATEDDFAAAEERGRKMLEDMRKSAGSPAPAKKQPGLNLTPEELAPMDPTDGVMPEAVSNRMLSRVVPFAGVGVGGGILVFAAFYFARTQLDLDVPPAVVGFASLAMLLLSFAGITYGVMSTNLDEDGEQSNLGTENLQRNLDIMRGAESDRIAEVKEEVALEEAEREGIIMTKEGAKRREEQQRNGGA